MAGPKPGRSESARLPAAPERAVRERLVAFQVEVKARLADFEQAVRRDAVGHARAPVAAAPAGSTSTRPASARGRAQPAGRPRRARQPFTMPEPSGSRQLSGSQVLKQLRELAARGIRRSKDIRRIAPQVVEAAISHYGTIARARRFARLPAVPRGPIKWTRERLADELRRLYTQGTRITSVELRARGHQDVINAIWKIAGTMSNARRIAGIPEPRVTRVWGKHRWDPEAIVEAILERQAAGEPLAASKVPLALFHAAIYHCGSWQEAIEQAGLDYDAIRLVRPPHSEQELLTGLRMLAEAQPEMTRSQLHLLPLAIAARKAFGSLEAAVQAAGLDGWPCFEKPPVPEKQGTLELIRERHDAGAAMTPAVVSLDDKRLYRAAQRHFGSWDRAVVAAGLPIQRHRTVWSKERVIESLRARHATGQPIAARKILKSDGPLYFAMRSQFGGIAEAARAAGVPMTPRRREPAREE